MMRFILPLVVFLGLAALLYVSMSPDRDPRDVPSPMIGKPAPTFTLPQLHDPARQFSSADMRGKVWLLNVWASWCSACRDEHPVLMELAQQNAVPIYGLDWKDQRGDGEAWLKQGGDPYTGIAFDADNRVGIDFGVYGVPETYVIDKQGVIRHKQTGPVTRQAWHETLLPLIRKLEQEP